MNTDQSVTRWIQQIKGGDQSSAQALWQRYFSRLVGLARQRLLGTPRGAADEEDVALSAFDSFIRGAEQGRFQRLDGRDDLWQVLVLVTVRKAADLANYERCLKRGGGAVVAVSALSESERAAFVEQISADPDPAFAVEVAETCSSLLNALGDSMLRTIAVARMEGETNEEIGRRIGKSTPTVERKLQRIRAIWEIREAN